MKEYLINVCILLVIRRDRNPNVSSAMNMAASLKALKNKDRMSVETALEVFHPNVQRAIPTQDIVVTLVPQIYTFWRQNRPGNILCSLDITIHQESGSIFFSDHTANQIMKCDLHSPSNLISIAGGKEAGKLKEMGRLVLLENPLAYALLRPFCSSPILETDVSELWILRDWLLEVATELL